MCCGDAKVYIGGAIDEADRLVSTGKAKAEDFRFFLHLCGWAPGQLEAEIERGVWFAAACSANVSSCQISAVLWNIFRIVDMYGRI